MNTKKSLRSFGKLSSNVWIVLVLIPVIAILYYFILWLHLRYGFRDGDWMILLNYKSVGPLSFRHLIRTWQMRGVYTYQVYYLGLMEHFYGINFRAFNITTQVFKLLAALSLYPLVLVLTKRKLMAFLSVLIYSIAYPTAGVLYHTVTGGYHIAIIAMNFFLLCYWLVLNKKKFVLKWQVMLFFLFGLTMFLNTERMYPLVPLVVFVELFWWWKQGYSKRVLARALIRLFLFLSPIVLAFWIKPSFLNQFFGGMDVRYVKILNGNWQLVLKPFTSFGSMFLPHFAQAYFGRIDITSLNGFANFFTEGPLVIFGVLTVFIGFLLSKKPLRFITQTMFLTLGFCFLAFLLSNHWFSIEKAVRIHFDPGYMLTQALVGLYVFSLMICFLAEWIREGKKNNMLFILFAVPMVAFLFIFLTWMVSDVQLVFKGPHRYLTVPAIGSSMLLAGVMVLGFERLRKIRFVKLFSWTVFLALIPLIYFDAKASHDFFNYELNIGGLDGVVQTRMKNQMWSYLTNFSNEEPSLFYFNESVERVLGYYHESTILAGFRYWMRFRGSDIVDVSLTPGMIRTNRFCPKMNNCVDKVEELITVQDGVKGISYKDVFYKPENIYAFEMKNKEVFDVTNSFLEALNLPPKNIEGNI